MMKLRICCLIALIGMLACSACMAEMVTKEYTDVASVMTQDAVVSFEVYSENPEVEPVAVLREPDEKSMALLELVYDFVWRQNNRPVRFYDEETQQKIQDLVPGLDIDSLHLTEFMSQQLSGVPTEEVIVERMLDVDYQPGQLIIVVLGYEQENGEYRWFPYLGEAPETGLIRYEIPKEDFDILAAQPQIIYHVLTDRVGERGDVLVHIGSFPVPKAIPSKSASDITMINNWYSESGEPIEDTFRIFLVDKTEEMNREIERLGEHLAEEKPEGEENCAIEWFPEEIANHAQLLLGDIDARTLIAYDIVAVMSEDYKDTYGDVVVESRFSAAYSPEKKMVAMLGFPLTEEQLAELSEEERENGTRFEWYCLRAEAVEDAVEIAFKQLTIPEMEIESAILVMLSEPLDE